MKDIRRVAQMTRKIYNCNDNYCMKVTTLGMFFSIEEAFCCRKWQLTLVMLKKKNEQCLKVYEIESFFSIIIHVLLTLISTLAILLCAAKKKPNVWKKRKGKKSNNKRLKAQAVSILSVVLVMINHNAVYNSLTPSDMAPVALMTIINILQWLSYITTKEFMNVLHIWLRRTTITTTTANIALIKKIYEKSSTDTAAKICENYIVMCPFYKSVCDMSVIRQNYSIGTIAKYARNKKKTEIVYLCKVLMTVRM